MNYFIVTQKMAFWYNFGTSAALTADLVVATQASDITKFNVARQVTFDNMHAFVMGSADITIY